MPNRLLHHMFVMAPYRYAIGLGLVALSLSVELFVVQAFTEDRSGLLAPFAVGAWMLSLVFGFLTFLSGLNLSEQRRSLKSHSVSLQIQPNRVITSHGGRQDVIEANFSSEHELVASPRVLRAAILKSVRTVLQIPMGSSINHVTIDLSMYDMSLLSEGQRHLVDHVVRNGRPLQIIKSL